MANCKTIISKRNEYKQNSNKKEYYLILIKVKVKEIKFVTVIEGSD